MSKSLVFATRQLLIFLALVTLVGCGTNTPTDPLAGVGGYKLTYPQRENRRVNPTAIAAALRSQLRTQNNGDVVVRELEGGGCEILLPGASEETVTEVKKAIALGNLLKFRIVALHRPDQRLIAAAEGGQDPEGGAWVAYDPNKVTLPPDAAVRTTPDGKHWALLLEGDEPVDAWHMEHAEVGKDEDLRPCLRGSLNEEGGRRMGKLTATYRSRQLAIILDDEVISAPTIQSQITDRVQITGKFQIEELQLLVASLRSAGALGSLEPTPSSEIKVAARSEK